jgi:hypothetical protein
MKNGLHKNIRINLTHKEFYFPHIETLHIESNSLDISARGDILHPNKIERRILVNSGAKGDTSGKIYLQYALC